MCMKALATRELAAVRKSTVYSQAGSMQFVAGGKVTQVIFLLIHCRAVLQGQMVIWCLLFFCSVNWTRQIFRNLTSMELSCCKCTC